MADFDSEAEFKKFIKENNLPSLPEGESLKSLIAKYKEDELMICSTYIYAPGATILFPRERRVN